MSRKRMVEISGKFYFRKGNYLGTTAYDWIGKNCHGLCPVKLAGKYGFATKNGKLVIPVEYDGYECINEKVIVAVKDRKWEMIVHCGTKIISHERWQELRILEAENRILPAKKNGYWSFVNLETGLNVTPYIYDDVGMFQDGVACVCYRGKWGLIDSEGKVVVKPKYEESFYFDGEFAIVPAKICSYRVIFDWWNSELEKYCKCVGKFKEYEYVLIDKKGHELVRHAVFIKRTAPNVFRIKWKKHVYESTQEFYSTLGEFDAVKAFYLLEDSYVVMEDALYTEGYLSLSGSRSELRFWRDGICIKEGELKNFLYSGKQVTLDVASKLEVMCRNAKAMYVLDIE